MREGKDKDPILNEPRGCKVLRRQGFFGRHTLVGMAARGMAPCRAFFSCGCNTWVYKNGSTGSRRAEKKYCATLSRINSFSYLCILKRQE
jgi:hypothetical protein